MDDFIILVFAIAVVVGAIMGIGWLLGVEWEAFKIFLFDYLTGPNQ